MAIEVWKHYCFYGYQASRHSNQQLSHQNGNQKDTNFTY